MENTISLLALVTLSLPAPAVENLRWNRWANPTAGGWVTSLQASPQDPQRLLIGGDMLGAGLSTNGGKTWEATFGFTSWEINDSTWHPQEPNVACSAR